MRTLPNPQRGCGRLKRGGMYLRSDMAEDGLLPPFVWFDPPIPWPEPHFRGYKRVNGLLAQLALWDEVKEKLPWGGAENAAYITEYAERTGFSVTEKEFARHIKRTIARGAKVAKTVMATQSGAALPHWDSFDLLMWVGADFYPTPQDFVEEVKRHGLSKRIRVGEPPTIVPGTTKLYLVHPKARDDGPGIFGYAYLTSTVFILPEDGRIPHVVEEWERLEKVEIVDIEDPEESPLLGGEE